MNIDASAPAPQASDASCPQLSSSVLTDGATPDTTADDPPHGTASRRCQAVATTSDSTPDPPG